MFKDIADAMKEGFGTCLKEIKYLSERVEAVEKKVGITTKRKGTSSQNTTSPPKPTLEPGSESVNGTNAGRKSLVEDKGPDVPAAVPADASSSKDKAPEPSLVILDKNQSTRPTNIPPARAGDCGVYTLNYIECHALGIEFSKKDFAKANGKSMRDKMAVDIFQELPDAHEFEKKDMDDNQGAYDG
ncbi:unnamed protein product [Brassica oleracea]